MKSATEIGDLCYLRNTATYHWCIVLDVTPEEVTYCEVWRTTPSARTNFLGTAASRVPPDIFSEVWRGKNKTRFVIC